MDLTNMNVNREQEMTQKNTLEVSKEKKPEKKVPEFKFHMILDQSRDQYIDRVSPTLREKLDGILDHDKISGLSKKTVDFLGGRYALGAFSAHLKNTALELAKNQISEENIKGLVEKIYGKLTPAQDNSIKSALNYLTQSPSKENGHVS